ncbi:MAG: FecR family protein [Bacteroidetes bacterium]|nr:FecR family protein [Bacteroidota bacterium]
MDKSFYIADLIVKKIRRNISPGEQQELERWIAKDPGNQLLYDRARDPKKQMDKLEIYRLFNQEKVWTNLEDELFGKKTVRLTPRKLLLYAAAILLPLMVAGGFAYRYLTSPSPQTLAEIDTVFKPGSQKAVLILSDGGSVELGQGESVATLYDGGASITDEKRGLSYYSDIGGSASEETSFNELRTPRGGGYNLQLADGTKVWLNAGSSLRYPVAFHENTRQVFLEGEAYFEVVHDGKPFIVTSGAMNTRVLGTSFNISAYSDDTEFKTTLVEGKVGVDFRSDEGAKSAITILTPDEQATFNRSNSEISVAEVNTSGYTSWMNGKLEFHNETLDIVMKRLARWYDFDFEFENVEAKEFHFTARLDKGESISTILGMLEMTTNVKFDYRGNSIVVL